MNEGKEQFRSQEVKYLSIDDRFWSMLQQRVAPRARIENLGQIKIVFNSSSCISPEVISAELIKVNGKYYTDRQEIHFNISPDDIDDESLRMVIVHELVHYMQDISGKYPEMETIGSTKDSPWEKEAYGMMRQLANHFELNFSN